MHGQTGAGVRSVGRVRPLSVRWRLPVDRLIVLAPLLARALADWHERSGTHGGLCPEVIDLDEEHHVYFRPAGPVRTEYLAPEQTGRLRCAVDERCDLYALGVLLYQLATGQLPHMADGSAHEPDVWTDPRMTRRVERPRRLVPQLPESFEEIVVLLLAVPPHERYQSAQGLAADLQRCQDQLHTGGRVEPFLLAGRDVASRLRMYGRIHGRDRISARLGAAVDRVRRTGQTELVIVTSEAGLGKTAVVDAFADEVTCSGGRVAGGRFSPGTAMPYAGVMTVVDEVGARLAGAAAGDHESGTTQLRDALGGCAATLGHLSPAVAAIVDQGAMAAEAASPAAAEHRVQLAVRRLLTAAAGPAQPLVVTLDDLHWADPASVRLLGELLSHPDTRHLLVVATCQLGLPAGHPVRSLLAGLRRRVPVTSLSLRPLPDSALTDWVADRLRASRADAAKLVHAIATTTESVPLLAVQFLHRLVDRGALSFDQAGPRWQWRLDVSDERIDIDTLGPVVGERVEAMTSAGRRLLMAAAALGGEIDLDVAARVADLPAELAVTAMADAVRAGFLVVVAATSPATPGAGGRYRWTNQRPRQILLAGLDSNGRQHLDQACGAALRSMTDQAGYSFFAMVDHLNAAGELASAEPARAELAQLNLAAGRRAWRVGEVAAARDYFHGAVRLIRAADWTSHYPLAFAAYACAAQAEHGLNHANVAYRLLATAGQHAADNLDRATLLRIDCLAANDRGDHEAALRSALGALAMLDVSLPPQAPATEAVDAFVRGVMRRLSNLSPQALADMAPAGDARVQLAGQIAVDTLSPLTAGSDQATLLAGIGVELCLTHGPTAASSLAFAGLAGSVAERLGDDAMAQRCLQTALRLLGDQPSAERAARVLPAVAFVTAVWLDEPDNALDRLQEAYLIALEQGETDIAEALRVLHGAHRFLAGAPLDSIAEQTTGADRSLGLDHPEQSVWTAGRCLRAVVDRLRAVPPTTTGGVQPRAGVGRGYPWTVCATVQLAAACVLGDHAKARSLAGDLAAAAVRPAGFIGAEACFYRALAITMNWPAPKADHGSSDVSVLETLQSTLDQRAALTPARYAHKALLISAERARIAGDDTSAQRCYDLAIDAARNHNCIHIEAISAERAGAHAEKCGEPVHALAYRRRARVCFQRWNADAKRKELDPSLTDPGGPAQSDGGVDDLDLLALAHALEALSAETGVDRVADGVAELFLRHMHAERACVLLVDDDTLNLAAVATTARGQVRLSGPATRGVPLHSQVPLTVIGHVRSTLRTLAADRQMLPDLPRDPYLLRRRPRALLCAPLTRGKRLLGLVYLEYHRQSPPSRSGHLHALPLLCLHAATVLDQASVTRELFEATQILNTVFEKLPVGLILLGPDLTVRRAAPYACHLTGLPIRPGTPIAELFDVLTPADTRQATYALELALAVASPDQDRPLQHTITLVQPDGPRITLQTYASPLRRPDRTLLGIALLISEANASS